MSDHSFFQNRECEFFPCHEGIDPDEFNCLFCFCPLYALGKACRGNCHPDEDGNKACDDCTFPHHRGNYEKVLARYAEIMDVVRHMDAAGGEK